MRRFCKCHTKAHSKPGLPGPPGSNGQSGLSGAPGDLGVQGAPGSPGDRALAVTSVSEVVRFFEASDTPYSFTVPTPVHSLVFKLIGGGGGGGTAEGDFGAKGGGGGGFVAATVLVSPGQQLNVIAGRGGQAGNPSGQNGSDSKVSLPFLFELKATGGTGGTNAQMNSSARGGQGFVTDPSFFVVSSCVEEGQSSSGIRGGGAPFGGSSGTFFMNPGILDTPTATYLSSAGGLYGGGGTGSSQGNVVSATNGGDGMVEMSYVIYS